MKTATKILEKKEVQACLDNVNEDPLYVQFGFEYEPERYERLVIDDIEYLFDKFDKILIPYRETMDFLIDHMEGGNIYWIRPKTEDIHKYILTRMDAIRKYLAGRHEPYKFVDHSEEFLCKLEDHYTMKYVILNIDIKGSTKMSQSLSDEENATVIELFFKEMAMIVDNYNGFVLKSVGDGLIAYFPVPTFWGMDDNAFDCAVAMKLMVETGINKILATKSKVQLEFRIGIETGEVLVTTMGHESTKQHKDLIGETINISAKIQSVACTNQIVIGQQFFRNLGTHRRKFFKELKPPNWVYKDKTGDLYKVYGT